MCLQHVPAGVPVRHPMIEQVFTSFFKGRDDTASRNAGRALVWEPERKNESGRV